MKTQTKKLTAIVLLLAALCAGCNAFVTGTKPNDCKVTWEPSSVVGAAVLVVLTAAAAGLVVGSESWNDGRGGKLIPAPTP